jgi:hypothetical protein
VVGDEGDEDEEEEEVEVRCLKLDRAQNERLRQVASGKVEMTEQERADARFMVALRGPTRPDEWLDWRKKIGLRPALLSGLFPNAYLY